MDDTRNIAQDRQQNVDQEIHTATLKEDTKRRKDDGQDDLADTAGQVPRRLFTLRGMSIRPTIPTIFAHPSPSPSPHVQGITSPPIRGPTPRVRYNIRHTNSLPDRLNLTQSGPRTSAAPFPLRQASSLQVDPADDDVEEENISRTTAVVL